MVDGDEVEIDTESLLIEVGRLFVFYDSFFADTCRQWLARTGALLRPMADAAWKRIVEPPEQPPQDGETGS